MDNFCNKQDTKQDTKYIARGTSKKDNFIECNFPCVVKTFVTETWDGHRWHMLYPPRLHVCRDKDGNPL